MARDCKDLLTCDRPALPGVHDLLTLTTSLLCPHDAQDLAHGTESFAHDAGAALLVLHPDLTTRMRLRALAESFRSGDAHVQPLDDLAQVKQSLKNGERGCGRKLGLVKDSLNKRRFVEAVGSNIPECVRTDLFRTLSGL